MARPRRLLGWIVRFVTVGVGIGLAYWTTVRLADFGPELAFNEVLLPILAIALVVLTLVMAGILIRSLVRLIVERKRGILGARLRSKLVFFFLALVLFPALIMFSGSAQLIKKTVEGMLRTPVEEINRHASDMVDEWNDYMREKCLRNVTGLAAELAARNERTRTPELMRWLEEQRAREGLDWVALLREGRVFAQVRAARAVRDSEESRAWDRNLAAMVQEITVDGEPISRIDHQGVRLVIHSIAPVPARDGQPEPLLAAAGFVLSAEMAERMERIKASTTAFQRFRLDRKNLLRLYLYLIALIFLVTVFAAIWMGFYLARRITRPIQELAAASREISAGNLGVRVRSDVGDEIGTLVDAFNEMAGELQESREVITRSTAELRRTNRALDDRRRYIETLVAKLSTAVFSLDSEGRVTTANPAVEPILGARLGVGDDIRPWLEREGYRALAELLMPAIAGERTDRRQDVSLVTPRGTLQVAVQVSRLEGAGGDGQGTLVMIEDLTDLLRAQKAAAWREVARRIAHEIKNPLTPIQLAAQRLRKKFSERADDLDEVVPDATGSIEREVTALKELVNEFSRYARMPDMQPTRVDIRAVVESVQALYQGVAGVTWDVDIDPELGEVTVDADQIRRALINLVENSIAAMNGEGTLRVSLRRTASGGSLRLEVADSGPGIAPEDRGRMFVPYFSTKKRGTGLGLAIVHRIVSDHRGTIRIEDNEPSGARFVIDIPA